MSIDDKPKKSNHRHRPKSILWGFDDAEKAGNYFLKSAWTHFTCLWLYIVIPTVLLILIRLSTRICNMLMYTRDLEFTSGMAFGFRLVWIYLIIDTPNLVPTWTAASDCNVSHTHITGSRTSVSSSPGSLAKMQNWCILASLLPHWAPPWRCLRSPRSPHRVLFLSFSHRAIQRRTGYDPGRTVLRDTCGTL